MGGSGQADTLSDLTSLLRCVACGGSLELLELCSPGAYPELGPDGTLECGSCGESYPIVGGSPRMLDPRQCPEETVRERTAESFAYEWEHFGALRPEWRRNFIDYMRPHPPEWFGGKLVLDVGAGSGRHSRQAWELGARVVAVDVGPSIDVARRNLPPDVLTVQADAERLPFDDASFDFVMSIGVLHHLPNPERGFRAIRRLAKPGGWLHIYLYWVPVRASHRAILRLVSGARAVTTRLPHPILRGLCYPLAAVLMLSIVLPSRVLRGVPAARGFVEALPLKAYADYPFAVLVNDQFDRFSAPIERRFREREVQSWLNAAGLEDVSVLPNNGWVASGRQPTAGPA